MVAQPFEHYHLINGNPDVTRPQGPQENEGSSFKAPASLKPDTEPTQKLERREDALDGEEKGVGWDGPIWCSRFGRFEKREDAIADDWPDTELYRCEKHQCACGKFHGFEHRSYMNDIKRRVEPMVESIVRLEQVVEKLVNHFVEKGENLAHIGHRNEHKHNGRSAPGEGTAGESTSSHRHHIPIEESLRRLEARVESLVDQMVKHDKDDSLLRNGVGNASKPDERAYFQGEANLNRTKEVLRSSSCYQSPFPPPIPDPTPTPTPFESSSPSPSPSPPIQAAHCTLQPIRCTNETSTRFFSHRLRQDMPFSARETDMARFPFEKVKNNEAHPMFSYPRLMSSGSLQYPSSSALTNDSADSCFTTPYDEPIWVQSEELPRSQNPLGPFHHSPSVSLTAQTQYNDDDPSWMFPEELGSELDPLESMQLPLDVSPTLRPLYDSVSNTHSGSNISINSMTSPNGHPDLSRITEHETWNLTGLENDIKNRELTNQSSPSLTQQQHINYPSVFPARVSRRSSFDTLSNQLGGKPNGRSQPSSSFETQTQPKRRRSLSGAPETVSPPNDNGPDLELDAVIKEPLVKPTSKTPARGSHSVIERRYRENLNTKMTQLDQFLTTIHNRSRKAKDFDTSPRHTEMSGKTRKADILDDAMRYVKQAELEGEAKTKEIDFLRLRVAALEKLVHCGDCALLKKFAGQKIGGDSTNF